MPSLRQLTKDILKAKGLHAKKHLSQNFLVDRGVYQSIVAAADIQADDVVIEIGPGLGYLTTELSQKAKQVIAIEYDDDMYEALQDIAAVSSNITLINDDILQVAIDDVLRDVQTYKVVANIPYHITARIVKKFLSHSPAPQRMVLMVQKEVAERMLEQVGKHSLLSVSTQLYADPEIIRQVSKSSFHPQPKVDSAIIRLTRNDQYVSKIADQKKFWRIVKAGFSGKRKKLHNTISAGLHLDKEVVAKALAACGIEDGARAQHISIEQWIDLYKALEKKL